MADGISIDRTALNLSALVLTTDPSSGLWLDEEGWGRPAKTRRNTYAADSPFLHGRTLVQSVLEQSTLPFALYAQGATQQALHDLQDIVEASLWQFTYETTVTEGGASRVWRCDPADISWSDIDSGMTAVHMAKATVTIPVYPFPVTS